MRGSSLIFEVVKIVIGLIVAMAILYVLMQVLGVAGGYFKLFGLPV